MMNRVEFIYICDIVLALIFLGAIGESCGFSVELAYLSTIILIAVAIQNKRVYRKIYINQILDKWEIDQKYIMLEFKPVFMNRYWSYMIISLFFELNQIEGIFGSQIQSNDYSIVYYATNWLTGGGILSPEISVVMFLSYFFLLSSMVHIYRCHLLYAKRISKYSLSFSDIYIHIASIMMCIFLIFASIVCTVVLVKKGTLTSTFNTWILYLIPPNIYLYTTLLISSTLSCAYLIFRFLSISFHNTGRSR